MYPVLPLNIVLENWLVTRNCVLTPSLKSGLFDLSLSLEGTHVTTTLLRGWPYSSKSERHLLWPALA